MSAMAGVLSCGPSLGPYLATAHFPKSRLVKLPTTFTGFSLTFSYNSATLFCNNSYCRYLYCFDGNRIRCIRAEDAGADDGASPDVSLSGGVGVNEELFKQPTDRTDDEGGSFLAILAIGLGVAATFTVLSISLKQHNLGSSLGIEIQRLVDVSSSSSLATTPAGFSFKAFGYRIVLPGYAPGWIYFWLLMAAGCGLFISEEALNIWVGTTLARTLCLDGTWNSFAESFSKNAPYIISTVLWVYWGVCISDMVPFYLGKLFRKSGASDDVCSKLGIGRDKLVNIARAVQRYGNLSGLVERFSLGVRNPTAFLAGAMGVSPKYFFAGVCCGGLITLPIQLAIGFVLRERPLFAVATVATIVGFWTIFPYAIAASTALFFYLRQRDSS